MIAIIMIPAPFDRLPQTACSTICLTAGAAAFRQGDVTRGLFAVQSGAVEMQRHTEAGQRLILHRAGPGETLAEASLFADRYHCDCLAVSDSLLIRIDKAAVLALIGRDGAFAHALLRRFAGQVQGYRRRLEILAIRRAEDRVLAALWDQGQSGTVMAFAAEIGLSHEATYRALSALVKRGRVERAARGRYRVAEGSA